MVSFVLALLCAPRNAPASEPESLSDLLSGDRRRHPAESVGAILRALPRLSEGEREVARFLLAGRLAELGLRDLAAAELRSLAGSFELAPAAFVALARLRDEAGESEALHAEARFAPWDRIAEGDFDETVFRVARAAFAAGRHAECRSWLQRIRPESDYLPFSFFLTAQSEYALGRVGPALEATEAVFRSPGAPLLHDRASILAGDMLTEIGLYADAVAVLSWPAAGSAFRPRAERDATVARTLAALEGRDPAADPREAERLLDERDSKIAAAVGSPAERAARAEDLRRSWPSASLVRTRRAWTAERAAEALDRIRGFGFGRVLEILWESAPPTILYRLLMDERDAASPPQAAVAAETRFFFAPEPSVAKLLAALALFDQPLATGGCSGHAARAIRAEAASVALGRTSPPNLATLDRAARACDADGIANLESALADALDRAVAAEARERRREAREQRLRLAEAIAGFRYAASRRPEAAQEERP